MQFMMCDEKYVSEEGYDISWLGYEWIWSYHVVYLSKKPWKKG